MRSGFPSLPLLLFALLVGASPAEAGERSVLCHRPHSSNFRSIIVSADALEAHLTHGDLVGACEIPADERCDDGNACTIDAFVPGTALCEPAPDLVDCDDRILCTDDQCHPDRGCVSVVTCGPETPVCDPAASEVEEACTGTAGECPLDLIAAVNGWSQRSVERSECVEIRGFGSFSVKKREASPGLCGEGTQDISCCEEACDCSCDRALTIVAEDVEGEALASSVAGGSFQTVTLVVERMTGRTRGFAFITRDDPVYSRCLDLFEAPSATAACLAGVCTTPVDED